MGVDTPETLQPARTRAKTSQIRDDNAVIVADNHIFHVAPSADEQGNLFVDIG
jgi:hypothetical protein